MCSRTENSFISILEEDKKRIIIPIIQRDYAQGRDDEKAVKVRNRLLDDWISVLSDPDKRMDFNFIYGEESSDKGGTVFYPVDGQQRLTSLYLLHWYLAYKTGKQEKIKNWNFDYRTRNSASEFFSLLKNEKNEGNSDVLKNEKNKEKSDAEQLFEILKSEGEKKREIQNQSWFKNKWEHDPTISACLTFLIDLSDKIIQCEKNDPKISEKFWERLTCQNEPAKYFTYLSEKNTPADIYAARTYTRMNARGKRLTDFENLKAMIDELEYRQSENRQSEYRQSEVLYISDFFDRVYIDYFYNKYKEMHKSDVSPLPMITEEINRDGLEWFRSVYYIYKCAFHSEKGSCDYSEIKGSYEDDIYQLSQGRRDDENISEYLKMLKAVLELVCNTPGASNGEVLKLNTFQSPKREMIAFVLFAYKKWKKTVDKSKQEETNGKYFEKWKEFRSLLNDLDYEHWSTNNNDITFTKIILNILEQYLEKLNSKDYFISHDFEAKNPFDYDKDNSSNGWKILTDLKCRVLECKIMWHLVKNGVSEGVIRGFSDKTNGRIGYLYYLCGYLHDPKAWKLDDWSDKQLSEGGKNVERYIKALSGIMDYQKSNSLWFEDYKLKAIYAYISQYDDNKQLRESEEINKCEYEYKWDPRNLKWNDDEYENINGKKIVQLNNLKNMLECLLSDPLDNIDDMAGRIEERYESFKDFLGKGDYEDCWLRFALQNPNAQALLSSAYELKSDNDAVYIKIQGIKYDVAVYTFLVSNPDYPYYPNYSDLVHLDSSSKWFRSVNSMGYIFAEKEQTCTFEKNKSYYHSDSNKQDRNFRPLRNKNMDLIYRAIIKTPMGTTLENSLVTFEKDNKGGIIIRNYQKGSKKESGQIEIRREEICIDSQTIKDIKENVNRWDNRLKKIANPIDESNANGLYDIWLDLRAGDDSSVDADNIHPGIVNGNVTWTQYYPIKEEFKRLPSILF